MRLDLYLVENKFFPSRTKASYCIARGEVYLSGKPCFKPSTDVGPGAKIEIRTDVKPFVSLGGYKLEKAVCSLGTNVRNLVFIDAGASTGGFTDCLLRRGAKRVYCVDVGCGLLDKSIASDSRVVIMDNTNARYLKSSDFPEKADGITVDCSFISLEYILPPLTELCKDDGFILALIKPQFELKTRRNLKSGILKDEKLRLSVLKGLYDFALNLGLKPQAMVDVTVDEKKNREYIFYLKKQGEITEFCDISKQETE